jgi:uncharacterized membrane protein YccC
MAITARSAAWHSLWQTLIRVQRNRLEPRIALRSTIGVALPLVIGAVVGQLGVGLIAATGALQVAFRDSHAPYPERARQLLSASLIAGIAVTLGSLSGASAITAILVALVWAFGAGLLVAVGERAANLGMMSIVLLVIFAAVPLNPRQAALAGLDTFIGGLLQMLLAVALWPLGRHAPERRALAALYRALAGAAVTSHNAVEVPLATTQVMDVQAMLANEPSPESQRFQFLLSQAERARVALLALTRIRLRLSREGCLRAEALVGSALALAARRFSMIAETLELTRPRATATTYPSAGAAADPWEAGRLAALSEDLRQVEAPESLRPMLRDARAQLDALAGQSRAALDVARQSAAPVAAPLKGPPRPWLRDALSTLRANLTLQSAACRHGIRLALCVAAGDVLGRELGFARPYWIPMTVALVLKPDFASTFSRGALRLLGTYAGLIVATVLIHALPGSIAAQIGFIAVFMFAARWAGGANYGFLAMAVAALAVFLLSLDGVAPRTLISARAIDTTLGGAIALTMYALWPTREYGAVVDALVGMLNRFREYLHGLCTRAHGSDLAIERAAGRLARTNLEAAIQRSLAEPGTSVEATARLQGILASCRRLAHALLALEAALGDGTPSAPLRQLAADIEATLTRLTSLLRGSTSPAEPWPDLRQDHRALMQSAGPDESQSLLVIEADRITNAMNTLREEIQAWASLGTRRGVIR